MLPAEEDLYPATPAWRVTLSPEEVIELTQDRGHGPAEEKGPPLPPLSRVDQAACWKAPHCQSQEDFRGASRSTRRSAQDEASRRGALGQMALCYRMLIRVTSTTRTRRGPRHAGFR